MFTQLIIIFSMLVAFTFLGFMFNRSIKKHDAKMKAKKKKKGRLKQMPVSKNPGRR